MQYFLFFFGCAVSIRYLSSLGPGIKPMPPAVEAWSLNHWTARKSLQFL